jgi:hypothetical protein
MENTTSKVRLYFSIAKTLIALLLLASLLAVDLDLRRVWAATRASRVAWLFSGKYAYVRGYVVDVSNPSQSATNCSLRTPADGGMACLVSHELHLYARIPDETWLVTDASDPAHHKN